MPYTFRNQEKTVQGPNIKIDCVNCKSQDIDAISIEVQQTYMFLYFIPFGENRLTRLYCSNCKKEYQFYLPVEKVASLSKEELARRWDKSLALPYKACILIAMLLPCLAYVGMILAGVGLWGTRGKKSAWRTMAWIGFTLTSLVTVVFTIGMIAEQFRT